MSETNLNQDDRFSWIEVYRKLFEVILSYENKQNDLVIILQKIAKDNGIDIGLDKIVKNNQEVFVEHSEIDPFTVLNTINSGSEKNNISMLQELFNINGNNKIVISDFNFRGVPRCYNTKWYYPFKQELNNGQFLERNENDIPNIWKVFKKIIKNEDVSNNEFARILNIRSVGIVKLSQALYFSDPVKYIPLTPKVREYLKTIKIKVPKDYEDKLKTWSEYLDCLNALSSSFNKQPMYLIYDKIFNMEVVREIEENDVIENSDPINREYMFKHPLNQILYGPAGTGKTYNTINYALSILDGRNINDPQTENDRNNFKKYMDEGRICFVTFHQSYGYEDFVEGIRVEKNDQGQLTYDVKSGVFKKICDRAIGKEAVEQEIDVVLDEFAAEINDKNLKLFTKTGSEFTVLSKSGKDITVRTSTTNELYISKAAIKAYILEPSENIRQNQAYAWSIAKHLQSSRNIFKPVVDSKTQPYVLIIDEINRGNISKIFGELITLIEDSKRAGNKEQLTLTLPSSNKPFSVPKNLYIIGTMNSSDRSLTSVDIALRRRFEFIEMQPQPKVLKDIDIKELGKNAVSNILEVMNKRIKVLLDRDHCIGHAYFTPLIEDPSLENLMHIFEKRIIPLLQEYFFDDWTKINLVLGENGMVHTMNLDSTLFLSMNPSEIEHLKKRNWDVNNYLFQDAPLAIKVNALKQIISPKQDYKIPKPEIADEEAS